MPAHDTFLRGTLHDSKTAGTVLFASSTWFLRLSQVIALFIGLSILSCMMQGMEPVLMPILKGGFIFAADLVRSLNPCPEGMIVEFVSAR